MMERRIVRLMHLGLVLFAMVLFCICPAQAASKTPGVKYKAYVQNKGWQNYVKNGATCGTTGKSLRMESIRIALCNNPYSGSIRYKTRIQGKGWSPSWISNNAVCGKAGSGRRLEAVKIIITGKTAKYYNVYYRVYSQKYGWMGWTKNGAPAGTQGYNYRMEGLQVRLVKKGSKAPGSTANPFRKKAPAKTVNWKKLYYNFLMGKVSDGGYFSLAYIDQDNIPELLWTNDGGRFARVNIYQIRSGKVTYICKAGRFAGLTWRHKGNLFQNHYPQGGGHVFWSVAKLENGKLKETRFYEGFSFQEKYYRGWKASALKPISESQYEKDLNYYFPSSCRSASVSGFAPDGGHRCIASEIKKILTNPAKVSA